MEVFVTKNSPPSKYLMAQIADTSRANTGTYTLARSKNHENDLSSGQHNKQQMCFIRNIQTKLVGCDGVFFVLFF